jgi:hypothetical protein
MQLLLVGLEETDLKIYVGGRNKRANQYTYMKKWQLSREKKTNGEYQKIIYVKVAANFVN